jgi:DNA-directed RNA polymerase subunit RPC12/RpoP
MTDIEIEITCIYCTAEFEVDVDASQYMAEVECPTCGSDFPPHLIPETRPATEECAP